jgi:hypothetical protein
VSRGEETGNAAGKADAAASHSVYRVNSVTPPENDNPAPPPAANDAKPATVADLLALSEHHRPADGSECRSCGAWAWWSTDGIKWLCCACVQTPDVVPLLVVATP